MAAVDATLYAKIAQAQVDFDLNAPLTDQELILAGLVPLTATKEKPAIDAPIFKDLEDLEDVAPVDAVADFIDGNDYNKRYAHYLKCQALVALAAFEEGWQSLEELVLKPYVLARKRENAEYHGDDPHKAFSLRLRQQAAEDFMQFIRMMVAEAAATPKPVLKK